jgi:hypothetical protein
MCGTSYRAIHRFVRVPRVPIQWCGLLPTANYVMKDLARITIVIIIEMARVQLWWAVWPISYNTSVQFIVSLQQLWYRGITSLVQGTVAIVTRSWKRQCTTASISTCECFPAIATDTKENTGYYYSSLEGRLPERTNDKPVQGPETDKFRCIKCSCLVIYNVLNYAISRKVASSISDEVLYLFILILPNLSSRTRPWGRQPITEMSTGSRKMFLRSRTRPARKADNLIAICIPIV